MTVVSPGLSAQVAAAFAAIVDRLGEPERRRFRPVSTAAAAGFLAVAAVVQHLVLHWPLAAVLSSAIAFVVGLGSGLLLVNRTIAPKSR